MNKLAIKISNLTKRFDGNEVLKNINLEIYENEILGILGPNGSGKSTLMKLILGMIKPNNGKIEVYNYVSFRNPIEIKKIIGYVPEDIRLYEFLTGYEFLNFVADIYEIKEREKIEEYLKVFELEEKKHELISSYSLGMKRKISIISALLHKPKILLLDEPLNGLDPKSARILKDLIIEMKKEKAIVISTHILEIAQALCDRVIILDKGQIVFLGNVKVLIDMKKYKDLEELFLKLTGGEDIKYLIDMLLK